MLTRHVRSVEGPTMVGAIAGRSSAYPTALRVGAVLFVAALTGAAAQIAIPLPFTPVPLTIQPVIVLLGGAALGRRLGALSQLLYLAAGLAGMPVFAAVPGLPPGIARLFGPTGGYLVSYPLAAWVVGTLAERGLDRRYAGAVASMIAGLATIFAFGVLWLAALGHSLSVAVRLGLLPFVLMDVAKVLVAAAALPAMWRLLGRER